MLFYVTHPRSEILTALAVKIGPLNYIFGQTVAWYEFTDVSDKTLDHDQLNAQIV